MHHIRHLDVSRMVRCHVLVAVTIRDRSSSTAEPTTSSGSMKPTPDSEVVTCARMRIDSHDLAQFKIKMALAALKGDGTPPPVGSTNPPASERQ